MSKEFRLMILSEKSGRNYSIKTRLMPLLLLIFGFFGIIALTVISIANYVHVYQQITDAEQMIGTLEKDLAELKEQNREAVQYKQWADAIIYRRTHYDDITGKGTMTAGQNSRAGEVPGSDIKPKSSLLDIDEFDVRRLNLELDFEVSFKLINRSNGRKKLSGYLHIVASNNDVKPDIYSSWPPGELLSGMPQDYKKGSKYAISYLKQVKGRINQPDIGSKFNRVDVIAYSEDGNIVLKKGFYVERLLQQNPYE